MQLVTMGALSDTLAHADLLTAQQVAELMGVSVNTVRGYLRKQKLARVNPAPAGVVAYYRRADAIALRESLDRWKENRAVAVIDGKKRCSGCQEMKPVGEFHKNGRSTSGLASKCKPCQSEDHRAWYQANWARERAKRVAYKKAHPEMVRQHRRAAYHRDPHKAYLQHKRWVERNRDHCRDASRAYQRANAPKLKSYRQQREALAWGLSGPITKRDGFALVVDRSGIWRAARLDVPFEKGERAVVKFCPSLSKAGKWIVRPWTVLGEDLRREAQSIISRCSKLRFSIGIGKRES